VTSREFEERLVDRAASARLTLERTAIEHLETYFRLLARWNATINLTALPVGEPTDETFDRLLIEPLAASRLVADSPLTWFDLGSGGGSPAIPLKILRTRLGLTMVEAKERKAAFLREVVRVLRLGDVVVENARFEALPPELTGTADLVTVRAVRADAVMFATAAKLLRDAGRVLWFGTGPGPTPGNDGFRVVEAATLLGRDSSTVTVLERVFV
jgi:16S rRNA (guanine527-N7)-methyltransferase